MKAIVKRELKNYIRNPILWIGILLVLLGIYTSTRQYLDLRYFERDDQIVKWNKNINEWTPDEWSAMADADIMQGYIKANEAQQLQAGLEAIEIQLAGEFGLSREEAKQAVNEVREACSTIPEASAYLEKKFGYSGAEMFFEIYEYQTASAEEVNSYIREGFEEKPFSYYYAAKFVDFEGLFMGFFATVLLAFLFIRDTKKDMYELLHTKPVSPAAYICGKAAGGMAVILLALGIINVVFMALCQITGIQAGFPVNPWHLPLATLLTVLPNMLMIVSIYTGIALIFKNPLPAVPLLLLYMVYSNMGSTGPDGRYGYYGRVLAIMVRFPGKFFDPVAPPMFQFNQLFLIAASAVLLFAGVMIWKRRRVY